MFPVGSYSVFVDKIKHRENLDIPITIGILIADFRQTKCVEYITNYISRFNDVSGKYIDFYIPGYIENNDQFTKSDMTIGETHYEFSEYYFDEFQRNLDIDFGIPYTYNPRLILVEYDKGHFRFSKKIIIELDNKDSDIKRTGELFQEIFDLAKREVNIEELSNGLSNRNLYQSKFEIIVDLINNPFLNTIFNKNKELKRYRLKK